MISECGKDRECKIQCLTGQRRDLLFCFSFLLEMPITEYSEHRGTGGVMAEGSAIGCYQQNWVLEGKNTGRGEHTKLKPEREKAAANSVCTCAVENLAKQWDQLPNYF